MEKEREIMDMNYRTKLTVTTAVTVIAILAVIMLSGCSSQICDNSKRVGGYLLQQQYLVGGGLEIDWEAPCDGTAVLVEETSKKIIKTETLEQEDTFEFDLDDLDDEKMLDLYEKAMGIKFSEARFSLYFIPKGKSLVSK